MNFRPLHDRVLVRRVEAEEKTAGGIIIPDTAKEKPQEGEIVAAGSGARSEDGKVTPLDVKAGDRVVASRALFGSCHWIVSTLLPRYGIAGEFVDGADLGQWERALSRPANLVLLETPSNPMLEIVDMRAVCAMAHRAGAIVVVDNVFATPVFSRAVELGADVVIYSATKHIDGGGRALAGVICGTRQFVREVAEPYMKHTGGAISPNARQAWLSAGCSSTPPNRRTAASAAAKQPPSSPMLSRALADGPPPQ